MLYAVYVWIVYGLNQGMGIARACALLQLLACGRQASCPAGCEQRCTKRRYYRNLVVGPHLLYPWNYLHTFKAHSLWATPFVTDGDECCYNEVEDRAHAPKAKPVDLHWLRTQTALQEPMQAGAVSCMWSIAQGDKEHSLESGLTYLGSRRRVCFQVHATNHMCMKLEHHTCSNEAE